MPSLASASSKFVEVSTAVGVRYLQYSSDLQAEFPCDNYFCTVAPMTGGAAVADVNGDRYPDIFVTRFDAPGLLFLNLGDGSFVDSTTVSFPYQPDQRANGAAFADVDNDGDQDLYLTAASSREYEATRNYLFVNDGSGHFHEEGRERDAALAEPDGKAGFGVTFGDFDRDGWVDLYTSDNDPRRKGRSRLLKNRGALAPGYFVDVTRELQLFLPESFPFCSGFADFDQDGWPDLAVTADYGTSSLFWSNRDGTFSNGTLASGVGVDQDGMGSTFGDFDGDGYLDWFVTGIHDPSTGRFVGNRLYRYVGNRRFEDITDTAGVASGGWGWGTAFFDYDNDTDLDLVMTNGIRFSNSELDDAFNYDPMRLWRNQGDGTASEVASDEGLVDNGTGTGLLVLDLENDGDLDVFVVHNAGEPSLYRNEANNHNNWLQIDTQGTLSNRDGIGSRVVLQAAPSAKRQVREIGSVTHYLAQSEKAVHFGLGYHPGSVWRLEIYWPSGIIQCLRCLEPDQQIKIIEPAHSTEAVCADLSPCEGSSPMVTPERTPSTTPIPDCLDVRSPTTMIELVHSIAALLQDENDTGACHSCASVANESLWIGQIVAAVQLGTVKCPLE